MIKCIRLVMMTVLASGFFSKSDAQWDTVGHSAVAPAAIHVNSVMDNTGNIYVSYANVRGFVKKYGVNDNAWTSLPADSSNGVTPGSGLYNSLAVNSNGVLYYSFQDGSAGSGVSVMKYDPSAANPSWSTIGTNISGGTANYQNMAILSSGYPIVADKESAGVVVRRYDGSAWNVVGTAIAAGNLALSIFVDNNDNVYVASVTSGGAYAVYQNTATAGSSTAWVTVGGTTFTGPTSSTFYGIALKGDNNGKLYMAYRLGSAFGNKLLVLRYNNNNSNAWDTIGNSISTAAVDYISMKTDSLGSPYILYRNGGTTNVLIHYNGIDAGWDTVGHPTPSSGGAYNALMISPTGVSVVAYTTSTTTGALASSAALYVERPSNNSNPLPVKLVSFTGNIIGQDHASLNWKMGDESDISFYSLERSVDGKEYTLLSNINKAADAKSNYTYIDQSPKNGTNYYRLAMIGTDGTKSYSRIVAITLAAHYSFTVFPNPANGQIEIMGSGGDKLSLHLVDITGKVFLTESFSGKMFPQSVNIEQLNTGLYFLEIFEDGNKISTVRFVKQ